MTTKNKILWVLALTGLVVTSYLWKRGADEKARAGATSPALENTGGAARTNLGNAGLAPASTPENLQSTNHADSLAGSLALALAAIAKETDPGLQSAALLKLVESLRLTDVPVALIATANQSDRVPSEFRQMLVRRWAKSDAPGAADWIEKNLTGAARAGALNTTASAWAETDAAGAEQWARRLTDPDERGISLLAIAGEMTGENPAAALALAVDLPPGTARDEFLIHAASEWAGLDPKSAIEWGQKIEDPALRAEMLAAIATGFAEQDPAAAATLAAQSLPPGRAQDDAVVSIVERWVQQSPEQAAAWVAAFPAGELRDTALEAVVKLWADQDLTDAGAWINTLTERSGSDVAIAAYVDKLSVQFPELAVEWAAEIRSPALRDERLVHLAELWLHNDAPAARAWIIQSPLASETKSRLLGPP